MNKTERYTGDAIKCFIQHSKADEKFNLNDWFKAGVMYKWVIDSKQHVITEKELVAVLGGTK